jgi:hypothetical protein
MGDGDHSTRPEGQRRSNLLSHPEGAMRAQEVEGVGRVEDLNVGVSDVRRSAGDGHGVMSGETPWYITDATESSRETNRAQPREAAVASTTLREAPWSAVRSTALGGDAASRKRHLECWSLLQLSGAELALREATQHTTTRLPAASNLSHQGRELRQPWLHGSKLPTRKREQAPALQISTPLRPESSPPKRCFAHALQGASRKVVRGVMDSSSGLRLESRDATTTQ